MGSARFLMTDPSHYAVRYRINPWMRPEVWRAGSQTLAERALDASRHLASALDGLGARIEWVVAQPGLPDLVFPANAGVVLDGKVLLAKFRHAERRGEEPVFRHAFERLKVEGVLREIIEPPAGAFQEGAGDAIWDDRRGLFWAGFGPRSDARAADAIAGTFAKPVVPLGLVTERFYHLDTCFCPLEGGEILYYPPAFAGEALSAIRERVSEDQLIEASDEEAAAFCVNAISLGRDIVMARAPDSLKRRLHARGYRVREVDLSPFILSGGAAFCMTLRLDRTSAPISDLQESSNARIRNARALA
jgi:N-dimethylarginine dimethylaminohydrolase